MLKFPKSFFWGAATSSYQVEGGNKYSDWWHWEIKNKNPDKEVGIAWKSQEDVLIC